MKKFITILLFSLFLIFNNIYAYKIDIPIGGTVTSLGGLVLDRGLGGLNIIYNPNLISVNLEKKFAMNFATSYAQSPYGIEGLNNGSFGVGMGIGLSDNLIIGAGIGLQMDLVLSGISEYRLYIGGSAYYKGLSSLIKFLSFIDGIAVGLNIKVLNYSANVTGLEDITGFKNNPMGFDMDTDITFILFKDKINIGLMISDILKTEVSFFNRDKVGYKNTSIIAHGKINIIKDFDIYGSINLTGSEHFINRNNFFGSSTLLANTYFGIEAGFSDSIYLRVGLNEGRLSGGVGISIDRLTVNVGVYSITGLSLYYQVDINVNI